MALTALRSQLFGTETRATVSRHFAWRTAALFASKGLRFIVLLLAARWLGSEGFGLYSYALSLASLAFTFSDFGVNILLVRDIQQRPDQLATFRAALWTKLLVSLLSFAAGIPIFIIAAGRGMLPLGALVMAVLVLTNLRELYTSLITARQRGELEGVLALLEAAVTLVLVFTLLHPVPTPVGFGLLNAAALLAALTGSWWICRTVLGFSFGWARWPEVARLMKQGWPLALFGLTSFIFFSTDQLFLEHYRGLAVVGEYSLATRAIYSAMLLPSLAVSVLLPVMARDAGTRASMRRFLRQGTAALFALGLVVAAAAWLLAPLLPKLVGSGYAPAVHTLRTLAFILAPMFTTVILDNILISLGKQVQDFCLTLLAAAVNLALVAWLVPRFGVTGAVLSSIAAQVVNVSLTFWYASRCIRKLPEADA